MAACVGFVLTASLWAQNAPPAGRIGIPQDWSEHSIAFSLSSDGLAQHPDSMSELMSNEPRILHQMMHRFPDMFPGLFRGTENVLPAAVHNQDGDNQDVPKADGHKEDDHSPDHSRDWSVNLVRGHISPEMYPAKYSFDASAPPSCTNDFVVFGLATAAATGGQANLVAFNNLYIGAGGYCTGSVPSLLFAYNTTTGTGGKIITSPVLSLDGTKIAFVESLGTSSVFHVLTWQAGQGQVTDAAKPTAMTSLTFSNSANTSTSSPWIDYAGDVVYVADDNGIVHKITPVFNGTPALAGSPWPVTVSTGRRLTPPVLDKSRGILVIGGRTGDLYEVNTTNGAVSALIVGAHGKTDPGILAPPIVDVTNGTTFVVSSDDGTSAVLVQADTTTLTQLAKSRIGVGSAAGTAVNIYQPALSNAYYTNPSTGAIYTCGTGVADSTPWVYSFGFAGRNLLTTPISASQLLTSTTASCTTWTEFFNPNIGGANGTDFFFFGLTEDCVGANGCVAEITTTSSTPVTAAVNGGPSGIVVDNFSTVGQASSIYLTGEKTDTAYKFTQNGLN
jgi:hypothetical protein